jgi:NAD(P)-dependent dehydrogenase (short-subunit alcohol dehydrogenase family)
MFAAHKRLDDHRENIMNIQGSVGLVTGGSRGLGKAIAAELLARGCSKVYVTSRTPQATDDPRLIPIQLDVTDPDRIREVSRSLTDVSILVNNAGIDNRSNVLEQSLDSMREEFETNALSLVAMSRSFAPTLAKNGGGAVVNILSALSWISARNGYSASKAAAWSFTNGLRAVLAGNGTLVLGAHLAFADTDMTANLDVPKTDPSTIASAIVEGLIEDQVEVLADDITRSIKPHISGDPRRLVLQPVERK